MVVSANQQTSNYYDFYRDREVVFTKDILKSLRIDPRQLCIKCNGAQWPCIVNSTSFQMSKIILGKQGGAFAQISAEEAPPVNIRFHFNEPGAEPLILFISAKVTDIKPYAGSEDLAIITLTYTQRPPDDFILKIGEFIEVNENSSKMKEARVPVNADTKSRLSIEKEETAIWIQNVPRRCVLRDLSFGGAKIMLLGIAKFVQGKECSLRIQFTDPFETVDIKGSIVSTDPVEGRQDIVSAVVKFDEPQIPLSYKIHVNSCLAVAQKSRAAAAPAAAQKGDAPKQPAASAAAAQK